MATESDNSIEPSTGAEGVFPPFDETTFLSQIFWLVLTFGFFYYIMAKFALPRVAGILESREDKIAGDIAESERLSFERDEAEKTYHEKRDEAHSNAQKIISESRETMNQQITEKRENTELFLSQKLKDAEKRIDEIKSKALASVDEIATNTARELVHSLIGTSEKAIDFSGAVATTKGKM